MDAQAAAEIPRVFDHARSPAKQQQHLTPRHAQCAHPVIIDEHLEAERRVPNTRPPPCLSRRDCAGPGGSRLGSGGGANTQRGRNRTDATPIHRATAAR